MRTVFLLALLALPLAAQEEEGFVFGKQPIACNPIECEVRVPNGWKVAQDRTGLSAEGNGMGFVITREPLLEDEKTFGASWQAVLAKANNTVEVKKVRAGRYKAFFASWPASGRTIAIYRIHVPDQEYLYNVSFSAPTDAAEREALVAGVLKSFKCTSKKAKLALQKIRTAIGNAGQFQLPEGFAEKPSRWRGKTYVKTRPGYAKPQQVGVIYTGSFRVGLGLPGGGTTSKGEDLNRFIIGQLGQAGMKFGDKFKTKSATYGGFKGALTTGRATGTEGETYHVYLWSGKGKRQTASIVLVLHERELRVHKKYFTTVAKTFKAKK